jgi:hypothetical protein
MATKYDPGKVESCLRYIDGELARMLSSSHLGVDVHALWSKATPSNLEKLQELGAIRNAKTLADSMDYCAEHYDRWEEEQEDSRTYDGDEYEYNGSDTLKEARKNLAEAAAALAEKRAKNPNYRGPVIGWHETAKRLYELALERSSEHKQNGDSFSRKANEPTQRELQEKLRPKAKAIFDGLSDSDRDAIYAGDADLSDFDIFPKPGVRRLVDEMIQEWIEDPGQHKHGFTR